MRRAASGLWMRASTEPVVPDASTHYFRRFPRDHFHSRIEGAMFFYVLAGTFRLLWQVSAKKAEAIVEAVLMVAVISICFSLLARFESCGRTLLAMRDA